MISDKKAVQYLLSRLVEEGIHNVILSPGSRNAPFSISLFGHPVLRTHLVADERSAGFIALGMAQLSGVPTVLICTSGTAVLNYTPAVAEALYQRVPLLIISADRPPEWVDQGEGQTIRQSGVMRNIVKHSADVLTEPLGPEEERTNREIIDRAIGSCLLVPNGPVHLNFPFREPLYGLVDVPAMGEAIAAPLGKRDDHKEIDFAALAEELSAFQRVLILAGQLPPDVSFNQALGDFARGYQVAVMTESHSNLSGPSFITTIDRLIMGWSREQKKHYAPDLVITIGHNIISRKVKAWLREFAGQHWSVDPSGERTDTFRKLSKTVPCSPDEFISGISGYRRPGTPNSEVYVQELLRADHLLSTVSGEVLNSLPYSDLTVMALIMRSVPSGWDIQMGNSSVVRYIQLSSTRPDLRYFGNRGVSGIDGTTSTAVGAAYASGKPTLLITGDMAFFYDSNAFWNSISPSNLKIIVINNSGGGIFRIIEGSSTTPALDEFFEMAHNRSARSLAEAFGISFAKSVESEQLAASLEWLFGHSGPAILEIQTPREENDKVLSAYFTELQINQMHVL